MTGITLLPTTAKLQKLNASAGFKSGQININLDRKTFQTFNKNMSLSCHVYMYFLNLENADTLLTTEEVKL